MGKISNPSTIASEFNIATATLSKLGVVNVLLKTDTLLFIDPMLLNSSEHTEISNDAKKHYDERFNLIIKLLSVSMNTNDVPWRNAERLFKFPEISYTCLGYGTSVRGSGFGKDLISNTLNTAAQIVALGVTDVDLFMALALFEEGIGPDRISDMTTNIIFEDLINFSLRINKTLKLPTRDFNIGTKKFNLIINPYSNDPLILVPNDIVRDLPIASDWSDISRVVRDNEELRERVNNQIGTIWATMSKQNKFDLKKNALKSKKAFDEVIALIREVTPTPYDFKSDHNGEVFWTELLDRIAKQHPLDLTKFQNKELGNSEAKNIVTTILNQFKDLVENKGLWKELWDDSGRPRKEKAAQRLFFAVAHSYCKANNLDLTPEADAGNGPVDFKISHGHSIKIIIEIKLSTNGSLIHGYEKQLEIYKKADDTLYGVLLLIDVGGLGRKYNEIQNSRNAFMKANGLASDIIYVDGQQKLSASKRV